MFRCLSRSAGETAQKAIDNPAKQVLLLFISLPLQLLLAGRSCCHASLQEVQKMHRRLDIHVNGWCMFLFPF